MRGATRTSSARPSATSNFNPRSSCEERRVGSPRKIIQKLFQSTLLMRGATPPAVPEYDLDFEFQSTLLMRGATARLAVLRIGLNISIHAPHARSDVIRDLLAVLPDAISIHAPHARSDPAHLCWRPQAPRISIHAPHARSDGLDLVKIRDIAISIHAPHARSDSHPDGRRAGGATHFNPRSSCEERLACRPTARDARRISIHAPHARSDHFLQ